MPNFEFGGYFISRASTIAERQEAFQLRFSIFSDEGFIDPAHFPSGELRDRFDDVSTQILVRDDSGKLIATTRFVRSSGLGFPTEHLFDFDEPAVDRARLGEYGRLAIHEEHRGGTKAPMLAMLKAVFECMIEDRTTHVFAFLSPGLARSYAALGCVSEPLSVRPSTAATRASRAPMRGYFETQQVLPVLFNLQEMMAQVGVPADRPDLDFVDARRREALGVEPARSGAPSSAVA